MIKVIVGVEDFLRDKLVKENKGLVDYEMNLMESDTFTRKEVEFLSTSPFMDEYRVLIYKTEVLASNDSLYDYISENADDPCAVLVIVCDSIDKRVKLYKLISKSITECRKLTGSALEKWMYDTLTSFAKRIGIEQVSVTSEQLKSIAERSGYTTVDDTNLYSLQIIMQQLAYTLENGTVTDEQIDDLIGDSSCCVIWSMSDALVRNDEAKVLYLANKLLNNGENEIGMLSGLLYTFRVAYKYSLFRGSSDIGANIAYNPFLRVKTDILAEIVNLISASVLECKSGCNTKQVFTYTVSLIMATLRK